MIQYLLAYRIFNIKIELNIRTVKGRYWKRKQKYVVFSTFTTMQKKLLICRIFLTLAMTWSISRTHRGRLTRLLHRFCDITERVDNPSRNPSIRCKIHWMDLNDRQESLSSLNLVHCIDHCLGGKDKRTDVKLQVEGYKHWRCCRGKTSQITTTAKVYIGIELLSLRTTYFVLFHL